MVAGKHSTPHSQAEGGVFNTKTKALGEVSELGNQFANAFKQLDNSSNTIQAKSPKKAPIKEVAPKKEATSKRKGYIVERVTDNDRLLYYKVLTITNDQDYITVIAFKPKVDNLIEGAEVAINLEQYWDKLTAKDLECVSETSSLTPYLQQVYKVENEIDEKVAQKALFPSQIAQKILSSPISSKSLPEALGFTEILGRVRGGSKIQFN